MRSKNASRELKNNRSAQSALIDALLFFLIMILASVFVGLSGFQGVEEVILRKDDMGYTRDTLNALLKSTINITNYTKVNGVDRLNVELVHENVLELIVEDLMVRNSSSDVDINSLVIGIEKPIGRILDNLTAYTFSNRTQVRYYHYHLTCEYGDVSIEMTDLGAGSGSEFQPVDKYSAERWVNMPSTSEKAKIILRLWNA